MVKKIINTIKLSKLALKRESELELAYLYGTKLKEVAYMKLKVAAPNNILGRVAIFLRYLLSNISINCKEPSESQVLLFAGSDNQFNSLRSTIEALNSLNIKNTIVLGRELSLNNKKYFENAEGLKFGISEVFAALALLILNGVPLYGRLKAQKRLIEINQFFNVFCHAYIFLPYFLNYIRATKAQLVITSNDHNSANRSMRLAAELLGVKTLYMQHASVSNIFPPLEFDYALLDGVKALQIYSQCVHLNKPFSPKKLENIEKCTIVLSGQKKSVYKKPAHSNLDKLSIGLGVNKLDDLSHILKILKQLHDDNVTCYVRTHPAQSIDFVKQLKLYIATYPSIIWSNPKTNDLSDFFSQITCMIAADTSLHLEAALCGVTTFYMEMSDDVIAPDYYGYVESGLSLQLNKNFSIAELKDLIKYTDQSRRSDSIKQYSETYNSKWLFKEGELASYVIQRIILNENITGDFKLENNESVFKTVYGLR